MSEMSDEELLPTDEALLGIYLDAALPFDDDDRNHTWAGLRAVFAAGRQAALEEAATSVRNWGILRAGPEGALSARVIEDRIRALSVTPEGR